MTHLSSCYFCGTGLETPAQTYELADGTTTITLCRACREKLETVLAAVEASPPTPAAVTRSDQTGEQRGDDSEKTVRNDETAPEGDANPEEDDESATETANGEQSTTAEAAFEDELSSPDGEDDDAEPASAETAIEAETVEETAIEGETATEDGDAVEEVVEETAIEEAETVEAVEETTIEEESVEKDVGEGADAGVHDEENAENVRVEEDSPEDEEFTETVEFEEAGEGLPADDTLEPELEEAGDLDDPLDGEELFAEEESLKAEADDSLGTEIGDSSDGNESTTVERDEESADEDPLADGSVETAKAPESAEQTTQEPTDGQPESGDGESTAERDSGGDTGQEHDTPSETTISALEYNRVMRMLQNRAFPVDRDEIEVVAANAYDLAESECAQVIDLAVDRGLLEERDGELYRPKD